MQSRPSRWRPSRTWATILLTTAALLHDSVPYQIVVLFLEADEADRSLRCEAMQTVFTGDRAGGVPLLAADVARGGLAPGLCVCVCVCVCVYPDWHANATLRGHLSKR